MSVFRLFEVSFSRRAVHKEGIVGKDKSGPLAGNLPRPPSSVSENSLIMPPPLLTRTAKQWERDRQKICGISPLLSSSTLFPSPVSPPHILRKFSHCGIALCLLLLLLLLLLLARLMVLVTMCNGLRLTSLLMPDRQTESASMSMLHNVANPEACRCCGSLSLPLSVLDCLLLLHDST